MLFSYFDITIIAFTVIILLFLLFLFIIFRLDYPADDDFKKIKYNEIKKQLDTGDILAISYPSRRGKYVKVFTGSIWTHIGMVLRRNNIIYIIEMAHYSNDETGLILKPLKEWLDWNEGFNIAYRKYNGEKEFPQDKIEDILELSQEYTADLSVISWMKTIISRNYSDPEEDKDYYYCSEFLVHLLQSCEVLKKIILPCSFKPWELLYGNLSLHKGYSYMDPIILSM